MIDYKKYKWFFTRSGKLVVGGKSADSNDSLLNELKKMHKELVVMHTKAPGSPFCAIIAPVNTVSNEDLHESAIFTGCFSRAWKEGKSTATVHSFKLSQLSKEGDMKEGSWNVKGRVRDFIVKLELVITKQNGIVRAVPKQSVSDEEIIATAAPGKIDKVKVKTDNLKVNKEELISALPAGGVKIT